MESGRNDKSDADIDLANLDDERPSPEKELGRRIALVADEVGRAKLCEAVSIGQTTLYRYINGATIPPLDVAARIAAAGGMSVDWLVGLGSTPYPMRHHSTVLSTDGRENFDDFVKIPLYEITASAGNGAWNDGARVKSHLAFRRDWLRECVDVNPDSDGLGLVKASGDSMPKSAPDDAVVMIQPLRYDGYFSEGVHLMLLNGMHVLKYVQRIGVRSVSETLSQDVQIRVISENPVYPPIETWITEANEHETTVIGRAVWMGVPI